MAPDSAFQSAMLGDMLARVELDIRGLNPQDPMHRRLETTSIAQLERLMQIRLRLIEQTGSSISMPFYVVMIFWLAIVFASFGLTAPRNALSYAAIALGGVSIASAIFVILELDDAFSGIITVSSQPMRDALNYLSR